MYQIELQVLCQHCCSFQCRLFTKDKVKVTQVIDRNTDEPPSTVLAHVRDQNAISYEFKDRLRTISNFTNI